MKSLAPLRLAAQSRQGGLCIYCCLPMARDTDVDQASTHLGIDPVLARQLIPTAEHLKARSDGGVDSSENIAAAHFLCNSRRHRMNPPPPPDTYAKIAQHQVRHGNWFKAPVLRRLLELQKELSTA